jgi:hypothetical protein
MGEGRVPVRCRLKFVDVIKNEAGPRWKGMCSGNDVVRCRSAWSRDETEYPSQAVEQHICVIVSPRKAEEVITPAGSKEVLPERLGEERRLSEPMPTDDDRCSALPPSGHPAEESWAHQLLPVQGGRFEPSEMMLVHALSQCRGDRTGKPDRY